jgi:hypothetical protein
MLSVCVANTNGLPAKTRGRIAGEQSKLSCGPYHIKHCISSKPQDRAIFVHADCPGSLTPDPGEQSTITDFRITSRNSSQIPEISIFVAYSEKSEN